MTKALTMNRLISLLLYMLALQPQLITILQAKLIGLILRIIGFRKNYIHKNLKIVFQEAKADKRFVKKIYQHFGLLLMEIIKLTNPKHFKILNKIEGKEELASVIKQALKRNKGLCILTGHIGNWEIAGALMASESIGVRTQTIVKEMKSKVGNHLLYKIRFPNGVETILRKDNAVRKVLKALKNNEIVVFVLDQSVSRSEGVFTDFFARPACTMPNLATIVKRTSSPVLPVAVVRSKDLKSFRAETLPIIDYVRQDNSIEELKANCTNYNKALEQLIMLAPEQWIWMHNRWRSKPAEELGIRN